LIAVSASTETELLGTCIPSIPCVTVTALDGVVG
jgi:hypothetical protein